MRRVTYSSMVVFLQSSRICVRSNNRIKNICNACGLWCELLGRYFVMKQEIRRNDGVFEVEARLWWVSESASESVTLLITLWSSYNNGLSVFGADFRRNFILEMTLLHFSITKHTRIDQYRTYKNRKGHRQLSESSISHNWWAFKLFKFFLTLLVIVVSNHPIGIK